MLDGDGGWWIGSRCSNTLDAWRGRRIRIARIARIGGLGSLGLLGLEGLVGLLGLLGLKGGFVDGGWRMVEGGWFIKVQHARRLER